MFSLFFVHKTSGFLKFFFLFIFFYILALVLMCCGFPLFWKWKKFLYWWISTFSKDETKGSAYWSQCGSNYSNDNLEKSNKLLLFLIFFAINSLIFVICPKKETAIKMYIYKSRYDKPCHHHHQILTIARKLILSSRFQLLLWEN